MGTAQLLPAEGDDRWVTIACTTDEQWRELASVIEPALAVDPRFATAEVRKRHEVELDEIIGGWTVGRDRWETTRDLQARGLAAFPSLSPMDLWDGDPQLAALDMLQRPDHPVTGPRVVPGIPWRLGHARNGIRRPAPLLGQHTGEVVEGLLRFAPSEIAAMKADGALYQSGE